MEIEELEGEIARLHEASFAWALACCGWRSQEAEDVLQSAYVKVLSGRARFGGHSAVKTWLFGVIRNTAREERRRALFRRLRLLPLAEQEEPAVEAGAEREAEARERFGRLAAALGALARRQREVLELVFAHGMTIEQAACTLGVSLGAARVHYERGKKRLRGQLGGSAVRVRKAVTR